MIDTGSRYDVLPSFLLGFHGTDLETAENILAEKAHLAASQNEYDWLGHGIYFWEYSPLRAYQFVQEKFRWQGRKAKSAVIGAVIDPGLCLNLLDAKGLEFLEVGYDALLAARGGPEFLPQNGTGTQLWNRRLDCAVINMVHEVRAHTQTKAWQKANKGLRSLPSYDSVRGRILGRWADLPGRTH